MSSEIEIVKTLVPFASPFVSAIVETWVKPKLEKLKRFLAHEHAESLMSVTNKFSEYLERSYRKHSLVPILVFQNQQKELKNIYVPLAVKHAREPNRAFVVENFEPEFVPAFKKVLIRDTAGMGKSTLMKRLFLSAIEQNAGIPIFVELRKLRADEPVADFIRRELNPIDDEFDRDFILKLVKDGNFVFFFDGYDEIPLKERDAVTRNLQDFIAKTGKNLFIMTSRPESALASFADFLEFNIQPLQIGQAFELLRKYDANGALAEEVISKIEGETLRNISEFLTNPLLVSLLYKSYEYKRTIPFKKHVFYRQVYDALFESHDLTKEGAYVREKYSGLDSDSFHRVLRALGFITLRRGEIEYDKDAILDFLSQARGQCPGIEFKENDFLKDLLSTVPLFAKEGEYYRWAHKSLQDYFAAQFVWKDTEAKKGEILRRMVRSQERDKYYNLLDLYYDMDYKTFRQTVIYDYLSEFLAHYNARYIFTAGEIATPQDIEDRKILTFDRMLVFIPKEIAESIKGKNIKTVTPQIIELLQSRGVLAENYTLLIGASGFHVLTTHNLPITKLLRSKHENIFGAPKDFFRLMDDNSVHETKYFVKTDEMIVVKHPFSSHNQEITFAGLNQYVYNASHSVPFLNSEECRKMHAEIEKEIAKETSNDFLGDL